MKLIKINTFSSVQVYVGCVLVTFFAIRQLGSCYSMRLLKPKLAARVECEFCKAMLFCLFLSFFTLLFQTQQTRLGSWIRFDFQRWSYFE